MDMQAKRRTQEMNSTALPQQQPSSLLIIQSHSEVRQSTTALMRDMGYVVSEAATAAKAALMVTTEVEPDVVLVSVPALPSRQLADAIRALKDLHPAVKIIGMGTYARAPFPPLDAWLSMPFDPHRLDAVIRQLTSTTKS